MNINRRFEYFPLERVTREDGVRHYLCPETGTHVPSVTTILDATSDKKGALLEWKKRVGEKRAQREKEDATGLGSLMHTHIENYVMGVPRPGGNNLVRVQAARMADQIINQGLPDVDEVWGQEVALYYPGLYAGTTDLPGVYRGRQAIMDHKTAKKLRKREQITDYFDQLAAYALAHDHHFGTKIEIGVIFMVSRTFEFKEFIVEPDELEERKATFLCRYERFMEMVAAAA